MAITFVQQAHTANWTGTTFTSRTAAFTSNVTAGSLLVVVTTWADDGASENLSSVTDTLGNTWTSAPGALIRDSSNAQMMAIWYTYSTTGGANTVTTTFPGARNYSGMTIAEFSGTAISSVLKSSGGQVNSSGTSQPSGTITVSSDGALIISATVRTTGGGDAFVVSKTELSNTAEDDNQASQYEIQTTAATTDGNFTYNAAGVGIVNYAVFEPIPIRSVIMTGTTAFLDDFNRANGNIGSNYETMVAASGLPLTVFNNELRGPTSTVLSAMSSVSPSTAVFSPDQEAIIRYTAINSFDYAGPAVRTNPTNGTGYFLNLDGINTSTRRISRMDNGVITNIGAGVGIVPNVGDVFTLRAEGSLISAYRNGILVASASDATYSTGQPGVFYKKENSNGTRMDNFIAANVSTTGGSLAILTPDGSRGLVVGTQ